VKEVHKERQVVALLEECIESEKGQLRQVEEEQVRVQEGIRKDFVAALPPLMEDLSPKNISMDVFSYSRECDVAARQSITEEAVSLLVKRITHV
jgi:hypothetical protein